MLVLSKEVMNQNGYCSSGEEDGDEKWKEAIHSAAAVDYIFSAKNGTAKVENLAANAIGVQTQHEKAESQGLKLYQTRAQKLLNDMLEEGLEFVRDLSPDSSNPTQSNGCGIRLFRKAPLGIIFESHDTCPRTMKRPCIIPRKEINEKSKEFRRRIRYAAVDGAVIMAGAEDAARRSLARYEARSTEALGAAKREEERIAKLKKSRGEKWLPLIAKEIRRNRYTRDERALKV